MNAREEEEEQEEEAEEEEEEEEEGEGGGGGGGGGGEEEDDDEEEEENCQPPSSFSFLQFWLWLLLFVPHLSFDFYSFCALVSMLSLSSSRSWSSYRSSPTS